ncbi:MAG: helix-turn-helix transcriptional regulator [Sphingobacteriaceae bacterium]|nr:helix-turn-helix transcriptional regulator [Cytophagaceae bacterium]
MSIVSNNIKYLRRLNSLTQEQFARRLGIKRPSVGAYEEARAHPPYDTLISMAKLFSVTVDQLIKTDLRRVRETPDLNLNGPPQPTVYSNQRPPIRDEPRPVAEPVPIAAVVDKFYRDERTQIRLVAQRIAFKRVSTRTLTHEPTLSRAERPPVLPPAFNTNFDNQNGRISLPLPPLPQPSLGLGLVRQIGADEYVRRLRDATFLDTLPELRVPLLPSGHYRAFEAGADFAYPGASLIGKFIANWYELEDARHYVLVVQNRGLLYRRVYNQVKIKGILLLSADDPGIPSLEVPIKDVLEAWEVKAFLSYELPKAGVSIQRLKELAREFQEEMGRMD